MSKETRARKRRRAKAAEVWRPLLDTRNRTAIEIAAFLLDEAREHMLADWLLCARPEHARALASGVAVHALLRCVPHAWDALMTGGVADYEQAGAWYDDTTAADFVWAPEPDWLIG